MRAMTSGVFFRRFSSAARAAHPVDLDVVFDELPSAGGDGGRVDAEEGSDAPVAAPPALERFESGEQPPLAFVEEAGEQHDGGAQLFGHEVGVGQGPYESGRGDPQASGAQLARSVCGVGGTVEELAGELVPRQASVADELAQGVLGADAEQVVQLVDEVSGVGVIDECLGGCDESSGPGEADVAERPQAAFVEVGELVESVVAAAVGVAGAGVEVFELAERGAPADAWAEGGHHVCQGGDGLLAEQGDDGVGGELDGSHCGTITDIRFRNGATILGLLAPQNRRPLLVRAPSTRRQGARDAWTSTATLRPLPWSYFCADPELPFLTDVLVDRRSRRRTPHCAPVESTNAP